MVGFDQESKEKMTLQCFVLWVSALAIMVLNTMKRSLGYPAQKKGHENKLKKRHHVEQEAQKENPGL